MSEKIGQLKLVSLDGKKRATDCANTETVLRFIQTIPSSKAEPFKKWLAKVGYERIQEIEAIITQANIVLYTIAGLILS